MAFHSFNITLSWPAKPAAPASLFPVFTAQGRAAISVSCVHPEIERFASRRPQPLLKVYLLQTNDKPVILGWWAGLAGSGGLGSGLGVNAGGQDGRHCGWKTAENRKQRSGACVENRLQWSKRWSFHPLIQHFQTQSADVFVETFLIYFCSVM